MDHNQKHRDLPPHLEPVVKGRDIQAKQMYLIMRKILRSERKEIWKDTQKRLTEMILYGVSYGTGITKWR
jgi:hypothetical protein